MLWRIAAGLGADVPSQLDPRFALVGGAGEAVTPLPDPDPFWAVLLPDAEGLSTADVYAEADRLGLGAPGGRAHASCAGELLGAAAAGASPLAYPELLVNDLAAAAISLRPSIEEALEALRRRGRRGHARHRLGTDGRRAVRRSRGCRARGRGAAARRQAGDRRQIG